MAGDRYENLAKTVELFRGIDGETVQKIIARGRTMNMKKDEVIFYEGTTGNQMFVVLGGKVALYKNKKPLAMLTTGAMFGEMALISNEPRSATAVAAEDCHVFVLDETLFQKLMTKHISIRMLMNVIRTLCIRLNETNKRLTS